MDQCILIVDDDELLLESYRAFLELEGHNVFAATTPYKALQVVEKNKIKLAILDYNLPNMNGVQLGHLIHKIQTETKIMFISGNSNIHAFVKEAKYSVSAVLTKPIEVENLLETVNILMGGTIADPVEEVKEKCDIPQKITRLIRLDHLKINQEYFSHINGAPF